MQVNDLNQTRQLSHKSNSTEINYSSHHSSHPKCQVDTSDESDKLKLKLKSLGENCSTLSGDRCRGCTIPYFPPVSSSLQQATRMLGSVETAYLADSDNCMDNKSLASSPTVQLACKLNRCSLNSQTGNSLDLNIAVGCSSGECCKVSTNQASFLGAHCKEMDNICRYSTQHVSLGLYLLRHTY